MGDKRISRTRLQAGRRDRHTDELRQFFELEDFSESEAIDQARKLEAELAKKK